MKQLILCSGIFLLIGFSSCNTQTQEDKLAIRLSQSKSFIALTNSSLKMAEELKTAKKDTVLQNRFKNLDSLSKRDSILKYLYRTDSFMNNSLSMAAAAKKVSIEFPELQKLPKETKTKVWRKAASIIAANQSIK